jgi:serine/threonine-protein kinase
MGISSVPDLVQALRASALLSRAQAEELVRSIQGRFTDVRALARDLVRRDWVTPYQINQVYLGRGDELTLGPYVLLKRLGEGGMGQVFKARHQKLNRVVALKIIRRDKLDNPEAIRRFYREIQAAALLSHPNVVAGYDAGDVGGTYFFAMEYVEGNDLGKLVKQKGPLKVVNSCEYIRQAALGLQHAFEKGLVHRDIKPSNIIVRTSGSRSEGAPLVKVLDMGLVRNHNPVGEDASGTLTQIHAVLGTPDFISPEQALNARDADIRSDLYSLGCTFYYVLTGQVPFPCEAAVEKLLKHYMEAPPRVEALRPEVPVGIGRLIRKLMAKAPDQRYQTPAELAGVLQSLLAAGVHTAVPVAVPVRRGPSAEPDDPAPQGDGPMAKETVADVALEFETTDSIVHVRTGAGRRRRRGLFTYAVAGIAAGLMAVLFLVLLRFALS